MIALQDISLRGVDLSGVDLSGVRFGDMDVKGGGSTPEPDITDTLLLEGGSPLLLEDGNYFRLESVAVQSRSIDKSYWNF